MRFSVWAWILALNSVVANAVVVTNAPDHSLKKCIQDEMGNIQCEEIQQDETEKVSYWPPGPYVLPMTRYGCPESSMHGWREGFIKLAWKESHQIQFVSNASEFELFDNDFTHLIPRKHQLFLPATLDSITIYFCYKYRSNTTVDKGTWPSGIYSIYKTEEDCPPDFEDNSTNITVPDLAWWVSDGYLPDFDIRTDNSTTGLLQIKLCSRSESLNQSFTDDTQFSDKINPIDDNGTLAPFRNWTHYFLIKNKNTPCPIFSSTVMFEESVYIEIGQSQHISAAMMTEMDSLCFYEQTTAYSVTIISLTEGTTSSPPDYERYPYLLESASLFTFGLYEYLHHWTVVDLGRTIPVSAVDITTGDVPFDVTLPMHQPLAPCIHHEMNCFISSGKWNFLQSEALSCLYAEYCRVWSISLSLVFKRIMEGRYVTLMHQEIATIWLDNRRHFLYTVKVFTELITYDPNVNCNADLGMQNVDIRDDQISASSALPDFKPRFSRPYFNGWCPTLDDPQPYLKVVFPAAQTIEGITVHNSLEVIPVEELEKIAIFGSTLINFTYYEEANKTINNKILRIDSSKLNTEAHTFWFGKAIRAKIIMLLLEKEPTFDLTCLRFEILGCKQNASYDMFYIRERQVPPFESAGFVSEIYTYTSLLTSVVVADAYQESQLYKWIIQFPELHFIKLIFTSLHFTDSGTPPEQIKMCSDSIIISRHLVDISPSTTRVIDKTIRYRRSVSIETKETLIVLSFLTCPFIFPTRRDGFKAIAAYENIPTCFSIHGGRDWKEGTNEICRHTSMFITSLSYLGFYFLSTTEQWDIIIPTKRISLRFVEFHVPCRTEDKISFVLKDKGIERSFCNINRPEEIYNSSSDEITVIFNRGLFEQEIGQPTIFVGVKIFYTSIEVPGTHPVDYHGNKYSKEVNPGLHRVAENSYHTYGMLGDLGTFLDGKTFHEARDLSLQECFAAKQRQGASWWLLDLQHLFILDYIVLFGAITENRDLISGNCQITLSTGVTIYGLQPTGYICTFSGERIINQKGIQTRYVRLQQDPDCYRRLLELALCGVQVYGKLVVHGEWGEWSPWSDDCYCDKKQYRYRLCNDPEPDIDGEYCTGDHVSYRPCHVEPTSCKVYIDNYSPDTKHNLCIGNSTGSTIRWRSWSEWSACSSKCGVGHKSRHRECTAAEINGTKEKCIGESSEEKSCVGNDVCMVCSDTFSKCYSIITKHTNWKQAQLECFTKNMTLVSILSLSELRFVKYLLRERRKSDRLPNKYFDADFYVHIGLQMRLDSKYSTPIWENGRYALYFTAWKINNIFSKRCTRMNFKYFEDDKTWESEDCEEQLSEYTMCEYQWRNRSSSVVKGLQIWKDDERQMISEQIPLSENNGQLNVTVSVPAVGNGSLVYSKYLGKLNKTFSGKACQSWTSTTPHYHELHGNLFKGESISEAANYCRDLGDTDFLWCLTDDPDTRWEICLLKELKTERRCIEKREYTGQKNTTITGKACTRWDKHIDIIRDSKWSAENFTNVENYCRDHFNFGFIWCYIDSPDQIEDWEPCTPEELETTKEENRRNTVILSRDTFTCNDGSEIQINLRCNGMFECDDKSDETDCLYMLTVHEMMPVERGNRSIKLLNFEEGSFFRCGTGEWISVVAKCDTVIDCLDASDETYCNPRTVGFHECLKDQFQCEDGDCIHISQVCNYVEDCVDGSDEYCEVETCSPLTEYNCRNGQCIPLSQRCDAVKQCFDGSDENECDTCQPGVFHCDIALCIPMKLRCDNFSYCQDGTDELNCMPALFTSCQDVWNAGFRNTGVYNFGPIQVYCSFENVNENGEITAVLHFDINFVTMGTFFMSFHYGYFYNLPSSRTESIADFLIFNQANTNCTQQVMLRCAPSHEVFHQYDDEEDFECLCGLVMYNIIGDQKSPRYVETCPVISFKNLTLSAEKPYLNNTDIDYNHVGGERYLTFFGFQTPDTLVTAGPTICIHDFMPSDDDFPCNINGKRIPAFERCVYDTDASGFPAGCSDGSHLIDCEFYNCPENMLKCPGSYCIPQIFICDGIHQCPGGEDEAECGCEQTNNEIVIIYDEGSTEGPQFARFARQFYTQTNIVRLLGYKATRPLRAFNIEDILLEVLDIELSSSPNIEEEFGCNYKVFARELLSSIHFTNYGLKGVILFQNSEISKDVFKDVTKSQAYLTRNITLYRVSQSLDTDSAPENEIAASGFTDIRVRRWKSLDGVGAEYFSEMCKLSSKIHCLNGYKCSSSKSCIPIEQVCDGQKQCLHGDDELLCDFKCPVGCKCTGYFANCSATHFKPSMLYTVPKNTRHLDLSFNDKLFSVLQETMLNLTKLSILNVSFCSIESLSQNAFLRLRNLQTLDLSFNKISILPNYVFLSLIHLKNLDLRGNSHLSVIEEHAFYGLFLIRDLHLANAKILKIVSGSFKGLKLKTLDLSNNDIRELDDYAFQETFIENINFDGNAIEQFNKEIFTGLVGLKILRTPAFKFCCIRPNYVPEQNCYPQKDEFSSCDDLMRHSALQFMIWLIGIMALIGNVLSVIYRIKYDRERLKLGYGIFVTNLAVADFLMAIYLLIIAIADSAFRNSYIYVNDDWRHSVWCNIAGILSTTSSEASVLFLCFITLDRLLVIKYPFGGVRITTKVATICVACAWLFSVFVATLPVVYVGYFNNEFYSKSGVCIALPLTRDRPSGWVYSLALFVGLNFVTFVLVAVGQLSIFVEIRKSAGIATSAATSRKRDLKVARNLLLVVATDFLCWFPIGVMGLLALSGHPVSGEVYAWAAVFILPVNSALNPLLYTLSAIIGGKSFNPRAEEQSFEKITKDIGENAIKCMSAGRHVSKKAYPKFQNICALDSAEVDISWKEIIKIAVKVASILDTLHCSSLGIQSLDENSVFVEVLDGKLIGNVRIQSDPFVSHMADDKKKNVHQFGMIIRHLIAIKLSQK